MKRYLLAGGLSLTLLLATGSLALAQDDTDSDEEMQTLLDTIAELEATIEALEAELDGDEDAEDAVEEDMDDADEDGEDDKGTRLNPYLPGEIGTIALMTHHYDDPFSTYMGAVDDGGDLAMQEGVTEEEVMYSEEDLSIVESFLSMGDMFSVYDDARMYYPPYNPKVYEGEAELEFTEVLRGEEALDYLEERNFYDYSVTDDGLEWAVFNFTFHWTESDDPNSMYFSSYEFNVFDSTGVSVNAQDYYTYFDGSFESNELYVGGVLNGTIAKLVPEDESFMMRVGDNYWMQHTFFEFDAE